MIFRLCIVLLLLLPAGARCEDYRTVYLRNLCLRAGTEKDASLKLYRETIRVEVSDPPIYVCFKGMALLMQAKHDCRIWERMGYFRKGCAYLDRAIRRDPRNAEMRFYRYCVQTQAPAWLGYHSDIDEDRNVLRSNLEQIVDPELKQKILNYLVKT